MLTHEYPGKFMAASAFKATIRTNGGEEPVLIEMRKRFDGRWRIFTVVAGEAVHVSSLQALLLMRPDWHELVIPHQIEVLWNDESKQAELHEIYASNPQEQIPLSMVPVSMRLRLNLEGNVFETGFNSSLQDALEEIRALIGNDNQLWLKTCYECRYVWDAITGPGGDERDELSCYRDAPAAGAEVRKKGKWASDEATGAGDYFVSAFHRCAAWEPSKATDDSTT